MNGSMGLGRWVLMSIVMVLAGGLGGTVNYFLTAADDARGRSLRKSLALGIVASLMVPLFLRVVSSKILDDVGENSLRPQDVFVFFGFCLVAATSSTAFIQTVSARIVKELEERVTSVQSDVKLMIAPQIEQDPSSAKATALQRKQQQLDENELLILKELTNGRFLLRTRTSVANATGIEKPEVDRLVSQLARKGLVGNRMVFTKTGENRRRWFITEEGRGVAASPIASTRISTDC